MMQNRVEKRPSLVHEQREKDMGLILSADAKPRLKWTPELHRLFVDAVTQLGGIHKATPKKVMRVMGVPQLTLFHLKSHLQKYRLKSQQSGTCSDNNKADCTVAAHGDTEITGVHLFGESFNECHNETNDLQIAKALQMQLEVQQKLHEHIEVQRHLQLRIEAQGKYLQSVLKRAQETLAGCNISSLGLEAAKGQISQLASSVNVECSSSSFSELTEISGLHVQKRRIGMTGKRFISHQPQLADCCSMDSCLTSSERVYRKDQKLQNLHCTEKSGTSVLKSTEINSNNINLSKTPLSNRPFGGKRTCRSSSSDDTGTKNQNSLSHQENSDEQLKKPRFSGDVDIDLNSQYQSEGEVNLDKQKLDLNCWI